MNREKFARFELNENSQNYPNSILTLSNLSKNDEDNLYTCKARNQIENVLKETEITEAIKISGKLFKLKLKFLSILKTNKLES